MICLACGHEETSLGPVCAECGSFVGYVAEGRGYLPQLKASSDALAADQISVEDMEQRMGRMVDSLGLLMDYIDQCGASLVPLDFDDVQNATLSGYMTPVREGLERLRGIVSELDPAGGWSEETWSQMNEAQAEVYRGQEGLNTLMAVLIGGAIEQGVDFETVFAPANGVSESPPAEEETPG